LSNVRKEGLMGYVIYGLNSNISEVCMRNESMLGRTIGQLPTWRSFGSGIEVNIVRSMQFYDQEKNVAYDFACSFDASFERWLHLCVFDKAGRSVYVRRVVCASTA